MDSTYRLVIAGRLPAAIQDVLAHRFPDVRIRPAGPRTVLECTVADQPALRSLVTQVWDVGATLLLLADISSDRRERDPR